MPLPGKRIPTHSNSIPLGSVLSLGPGGLQVGWGTFVSGEAQVHEKGKMLQ